MEVQALRTKEVILGQTLSGNLNPSTARFMPQYLRLHEISEETTNHSKNSSPSDSLCPPPSNNFVDVSLTSSDGDTFLCNKLYLVRCVSTTKYEYIYFTAILALYTKQSMTKSKLIH
jgi:hypothetical protein